jgi:phosphatidate phosphatase APP1
MPLTFTDKILQILGITKEPVVRAYDGYGDEDDVIIYGHVLRLSPLPRKKYRQNVLINFFSLVRLFIVAPQKDARVILEWNGETQETRTDKEGFFKFEWKPINHMVPGWHKGIISYVSDGQNHVPLAVGECHVFVPHQYQYSYISDIDDTFLISHSASTFKRLYVLFTKNAWTRKPFAEAVNHYRLLSRPETPSEFANPFFYVSSSEWNLYYYIKEFCRRQEMPRGVFLLAQQRQLRHLLFSGQGKHATKYIRIVRVLKSFPNHQYVLLGDNTQKDPEIYASVVRDFPGMIFAVYIRRVKKSHDAKTKVFLDQIEAQGVHCCYFSSSLEAIIHSTKIDLIETRLG